MTSLQSTLDSIAKRWVRGIEAFNRPHESRPKTIRSAIYGNMVFDEPDMRLIESFYIQRLRHVSQMGLLNLVYPDARHSRFEHSLGVLWSLKQLLESDKAVSLTETEKCTLHAAAILHDCGHGPFSHTTESLLELAGIDQVLREPLEDKKAKPHERRCRDMIRDSDFQLHRLGVGGGYGIGSYLESNGIDPEQVVALVVGKEPAPMLNLLSGNFDVDKMDYFRRDAFFTGTMGGGVDFDAMQRWVRSDGTGSGATASFDRRLVGHLLHLLFAREHVYNVTAYHPVVRIASSLLLIAGDLALNELEPELATLIYVNLELLNDQEFLSVLQLAVDETARVREPGIALLNRILQRLSFRRLPKRLCTLTRHQFIQTFSESLDVIEGDKGDLPEMVYCRISDIAGGKYVAFLEGFEPRDDFAVLELSPKIGPARKTIVDSAKENKTLMEIQISESDRASTNLKAWLDENGGEGSGEALATALLAYKMAIWKALVLVPATLKIGLQGNDSIAEFVRDFARTLRDPRMLRPSPAAKKIPAVRLIGDRIQALRAGVP